MHLNNILYFLWVAIQIVIGFNLVFPILLYILHLFTGSKKTFLDQVMVEPDYAIIVTAYKQTTFLHEVVKSLENLRYTNYLIYIVADNCDVSKLFFHNNKVVLLQPEQTLESNVESHFYAIQRFKRLHDRLTIIDSDNLVHPNYLNELNKSFQEGYTAVQGVREPKNLNSSYACLDAARDIYYHFYDGKLLFGCGSSATLAGSGMAFTVSLYRQCLEHLIICGAGFDKVLQYEIVLRCNRIAFCENAIVYDEKTSKSNQLVSQRARWLNTWFKYSIYGFKLLVTGCRKFNWNQFLFGVTLLRPPLFIFLLLSLFCLVTNNFVSTLAITIWLLALLLFVVGFIIALLNHHTDKRIYKSLINIPKFIFYQLTSLLYIKSANSRSVATIHFYNTEEPNIKENQ